MPSTKLGWLFVYSKDGQKDSVYLYGVHNRGNWLIETSGCDFEEVRIDSCKTKRNCYIQNLDVAPSLSPGIVEDIRFKQGIAFGCSCHKCPDTLGQTDILYFDLHFCPASPSSDEDTLLFFITYSDLDSSKDTLEWLMIGTGTVPRIYVDSSSLDFDSVAIGDTSEYHWITVENRGTYDLRVTSIKPKRYPAEFRLEWEDGFPPPWKIQKGDYKKVGVAFAPLTSGKRIDSLQIFSDAYPDKDTLTQILLLGQGYVEDKIPPHVDALPFTAFFQDTLVLKAKVTDAISGVDSVWLYYRQGNSNDFTVQQMRSVGNDTFKYEIPETIVTLNGLEYKIRAVDKHHPPNDTITPLQSIPVRFSPGDTTVHSSFWYTNLPAAIDTRWVMLSIPGNLDDKSPKALLRNSLGDPGESSWRLFYWEEVQHVAQELKSDALTPGRSFWFKCINRSAPFTVVLDSGRTIPTDTPFPIELRSGWNMISNPFFFNLVVDTVFLKDNSLDGPYSYDKIKGKHKGWIYPVEALVKSPNDTSLYLLYMEPWKGYAVKNNSGDVFHWDLDPHEMTAQKAGGVYTPILDFAWRIDLLVKANDFVDDVDLGSSESCSEHKDRLDYPKPPDIAPTISIYFPKPDWGRFSGDYATDYRGIINDGASWDFAVDNYTDQKELELNWEGVDSLPSEFEAVLYDRLKNDTIDMREKESYKFTHIKNQDSNRFKVFIGRSGYIENEIATTQSTIPKEFNLKQNYPNPFNSGTAISFDIPQGGQVKVKIYNILGQIVLTLYDKLTYPGKYTITWGGKDNEGKEVSSGIYFYQLSTPGFTESLKMILLK